jgi:hypothetical protein
VREDVAEGDDLGQCLIEVGWDWPLGQGLQVDMG